MKIFNNLRFRLLLLVALAVIPALGVTLYSGILLRRQARETAVKDAFSTITTLSNYQGSVIEGINHTLMALSLAPELRDPRTCNQYLRGLVGQQLYSQRIMVADAGGQVFCAMDESDLALNFGERNYYQRAVSGGAFTVGRPLLDEASGDAYLPLVMPVLDSRQQFEFALVELPDLRVVVQNQSIFQLPPKSAILMISDEGQVLLRYPESESWAGQRLPNVPVVRAILQQGGVGTAEVAGVDGILRFYAFTPLLSGDNRIFLSVGIPSETVYASSSRILTFSLIMLAISSILAGLTAYYGGDYLFLRVVSLTAERDAAERKLREANQKLELRVQERTAQLAEVNEKLEEELEERKRTVVMLRLRELELKRQQIQLERSNRDLQDFAYITSHDLQEPLRKIQAFGDRLASRYRDQLDQEGLMFLDRMVTSARRMQNMINDLLQYSRVSTRAGNFLSLSLNEVVEEVAQDLEMRLRETGGAIYREELPEIDADPIQMHQLFLNLVGNSLKFHHPDMAPVVRISSKIEHPDGEQRPYVTICVEDNGIGFDVKYLDRIFQPFQRLHSKDIYEGSGIGLAICRKIVDRHGGTITAQSDIGKGSRFIITLPTTQKKEEEGI